MDNNWNVQDFLDQLRSAQPQSSSESESKSLDRTYITANLGKYQIFPMISTTTRMPFEYLYRTREVNITSKKADGSEYSTWHKLLPECAYDFCSDGRRVSSLTQAEKDLLNAAYGVFDRMYNVVPESQRKGFCRYKNYIIGHAHVINYYEVSNNNKPSKSNYDTLLVCTSKDFANAISKDIDIQLINQNNDPSFLNQVYNRQLTGRTGWLIFTIQRAANGIGFSASANHTVNLGSISGDLTISEEAAELMKDPVRTFLGRQAGEDKLFNADFINTTISEMAAIIAKYEHSAIYVDKESVARSTVAQAQAASPKVAPTNDPMIAAAQAHSQPRATLNQEQQLAANNNPFQTPPAAQYDPMSGIQMNQVTQNPTMGNPFNPPVNPANQYLQPTYQPMPVDPKDQPQYVQPQFVQNAPVNPFDTAAANPYKQ